MLPSSVYSYGVPRASRVPETHPRDPHTRKGKYRKEQEDLVMAAHAAGAIQGMIVRLPDFYGPHADIGLANPDVSRGAGRQDGQLGGSGESRRTSLCTCPIPVR